jgi:hypothetical protein
MEQKAENMQWYEQPDWVIVWVTVAYTVVALLTLGAIWEQVRQMKRQTDAATRNAAAFINKERSRLFISSNITQEFRVTVTAANRGQSPARVTYKFVGCEIFDADQGLQEVPEYTDWGEPPEDYICDEWVLPHKSTKVGHYDAGYISASDNPGLYNSVMGGEKKVWFFGIIRWLDSVSEDEHEIRFCYRCEPRKAGRYWLTEDGPAAYRLEK